MGFCPRACRPGGNCAAAAPVVLVGVARGCCAAITAPSGRVAIPDHLLVLPVAERLATQCGVLRTQLRGLAAESSALIATVHQLTGAWPPCACRPAA